MRFQIIHHYQGLRSHYHHGDVFHWCILMVLPHNRERVKNPQTVIYAWGRQTVLPFHFKENLTTGSDFTGGQVQWLNQSWSQRTRSFTKLQLMLLCVSIVRGEGGVKASSTLSNSCSNLSRILHRVRNEGGGGGGGESKTFICESA